MSVDGLLPLSPSLFYIKFDVFIIRKANKEQTITSFGAERISQLEKEDRYINIFLRLEWNENLLLLVEHIFVCSF